MLEDVSYYSYPNLNKQYETLSLFLKWQIAGVLWWRGHVWTVSAWQGERWSAEVWLEFSEHLCHKLCQPCLSSSQRTQQLNCATKHTHVFFTLASVLPSVPSPITRYSFQNTNSIIELLGSKRNFVSTSFVAGGDFFFPSPHCPYVAWDLLSGAVRQHTLALCHEFFVNGHQSRSFKWRPLLPPPGDNAASLKQAGKRRCPSTSIMEVLRVCAVFLSARPNSIGPFPKWELWRGWLVCLNFSSCLVSSSVIGMERKGGVYSRKG